MPIVWDASYEFWLEREMENLMRQEELMVWQDELRDQLGTGQYTEDQRTAIREQYEASHENAMAGIGSVRIGYSDERAAYQYRFYDYTTFRFVGAKDVFDMTGIETKTIWGK